MCHRDMTIKVSRWLRNRVHTCSQVQVYAVDPHYIKAVRSCLSEVLNYIRVSMQGPFS